MLVSIRLCLGLCLANEVLSDSLTPHFIHGSPDGFAKGPTLSLPHRLSSLDTFLKVWRVFLFLRSNGSMYFQAKAHSNMWYGGTTDRNEVRIGRLR